MSQSVPEREPSRRPDDDLVSLLVPLEGLAQRPVDEHPAAYEQVHADLRRRLQGQDPPGVDPCGGDLATRS